MTNGVRSLLFLGLPMNSASLVMTTVEKMMKAEYNP